MRASPLRTEDGEVEGPSLPGVTPGEGLPVRPLVIETESERHPDDDHGTEEAQDRNRPHHQVLEQRQPVRPERQIEESEAEPDHRGHDGRRDPPDRPSDGSRKRKAGVVLEGSLMTAHWPPNLEHEHSRDSPEVSTTGAPLVPQRSVSLSSPASEDPREHPPRGNLKSELFLAGPADGGRG